MNFKILSLAAAVAFSPLALQAQVNGRKVNQQDRIAQGVQSGQLTPRETSHLEHQEGAINREEHAMRAQDNGHLTRGDRAVLQHQQNQESRRIFRDKHNGRVR